MAYWWKTSETRSCFYATSFERVLKKIFPVADTY